MRVEWVNLDSRIGLRDRIIQGKAISPYNCRVLIPLFSEVFISIFHSSRCAI